MKRYILNFIAFTIMGVICLLSACSDGEFSYAIIEIPSDSCHWERADVNWHVSRIDFDVQAGATRSSNVRWRDGDRIYLILEDKNGNDVQAYVSYDGSKASWGQIEYDGYKSYLTCTTPRTVEAYYFDGSVAVTATDITFDATTGIYACTDGIYTYPADGDLEVSISLAPLTSRIRFTGKSGTNFSITSGMKSYTSFSRASGNLIEATSAISTSIDATGTTPYLYGVFANPEEPSLVIVSNKERYSTIFDPSTHVLQVGTSGYMPVPTVESHSGWKLTIPATAISVSPSSLSMKLNEKASLQVALTPMDATSEVVWSSSNTSVAIVSKTGVITAVGYGKATLTMTVKDQPNLKATCEVNIFDTKGHEYVDLGLPSGILWATMNVGASSPEDYGGYFAWGETEEKSNYDWGTYKWCNGSYDGMTKYCTDSSYGIVDNKTTLDSEDDIAHVLWGGSWRMPTYDEINELYNKCSWKGTSVNGVSGNRVTGPNGNSIFLPNAGYRSGTEIIDRTSNGYFWSGTLFESYSSRAYYLFCYTGDANLGYYYRYYGYSVRPVTE